MLLAVLLGVVALGVFGAGLGRLASAIAASTGDLSVVGPPSLDAALVDSIFRRLHSPMQGTGSVVYAMAAKYHIDDAFALAVWWAETNDGAAGVGRPPAHNPGGVKYASGYPHGSDGYTIYSSYAQAVADWYAIVRQRYIARQLTTVYQISHPYVGTASSPLWAAKVVRLMLSYQAEGKKSPAYLAAHDPANLVKTPAPGQWPPTPQSMPGNTASPGSVVSSSRPGWGTHLVTLFVVLMAVLLAVLPRRFFQKGQPALATRILGRNQSASQPGQATAADEDWEEITGPFSRPPAGELTVSLEMPGVLSATQQERAEDRAISRERTQPALVNQPGVLRLPGRRSSLPERSAEVQQTRQMTPGTSLFAWQRDTSRALNVDREPPRGESGEKAADANSGTGPTARYAPWRVSPAQPLTRHRLNRIETDDA